MELNAKNVMSTQLRTLMEVSAKNVKSLPSSPNTLKKTWGEHSYAESYVQKPKVGLTSSPNTLRATLAEHLLAHAPNMLLLFAIPCLLAAAGHTLIAKRGHRWGIVEVPKIWGVPICHVWSRVPAFLGTALETLFWRSLLRSVLD